MKAIVIGMDPRVVGDAAASVRVRWPDAALKFAVNSSRGLRLLEQERTTVAILSEIRDSNLSDFVKNIRTFSKVPLLVLGNTGDTEETVACLEAGADDYFRLPCSTRELTLRLWALVRRSGPVDSNEIETSLASGKLMMNPTTYEAFFGEERLCLTSTEFRMLHFLMKNWWDVVPRQTLVENLWPESSDRDNLVKKYVQRLRLKLRDDPRYPSWIANIKGVGYRFVGPAPRALEPASTLISEAVLIAGIASPTLG